MSLISFFNSVRSSGHFMLPFRFSRFCLQALLHLDERYHALVTELDGFDEVATAYKVGFAFNHENRVFCSDDDNVNVAILHIAQG